MVADSRDLTTKTMTSNIHSTWSKKHRTEQVSALCYLGRMTSKVQCIVNHITGGASGGSIASSLAMAMEPASELRKAAESVYYLCSSTTGTERYIG